MVNKSFALDNTTALQEFLHEESSGDDRLAEPHTPEQLGWAQRLQRLELQVQQASFTTRPLHPALSALEGGRRPPLAQCVIRIRNG